jgi:hypothetical protein
MLLLRARRRRPVARSQTGREVCLAAVPVWGREGVGRSCARRDQILTALADCQRVDDTLELFADASRKRTMLR